MKKIATLLIACAMVASMAACGSTAPASSAAASVPASSAVSSAPASSVPASSAASSDASSAASGAASDAASAPAGDIEPLTAEEEAYILKAEEMMNAMADIANLQTEAAQATDAAAVKVVMDKAKKPFADFAALEAPGRFVPVQEKFKSGCEAFVAYFDLTSEMSALPADQLTPEKQAEYTQKITDAITLAQTDLMAGAELAASITPAE